MRISDWSSDVCSSDLGRYLPPAAAKLRLLHRYGNSEVRNAVQKIAGAIQRIDNPTGLRRIAFDLTGLFQQETPVSSEGRRVGTEGGSTCSSRWSPSH